MSVYSEFFLNSPSSVVQLELLLVQHPFFTKDYRVVRNAVDGVTVTGLGRHGHNLFNSANAEADKSVNNTDGTLDDLPGYSASEFVRVLPGQTYTVSHVHFRAFYDSDSQFVSGSATSSDPATFQVPDKCHFVRVSLPSSAVSSFQLEQGETATDRVDYGQASFDYYPLRISRLGTRDNLDAGLRIDLGDLGEVLPEELDNVVAASTRGLSHKPTVIYHTYRSDDKTTALFGPLQLEVRNFSFKREGASFEAVAPTINLNKTGETYKLDRFPMLRGFL